MMALLTGWLAGSPSGDIDNPYLSADLFGFSLDWWPGHESAVGSSPRSSLGADWPVAANGRLLSGYVSTSYTHDYYHRIHRFPLRLDLGNVVTTQVQTVFIWNAHLESCELTEISGLNEGLLVSGQPSPPLQVAATEELIWQLSVTPDGQPVLDTLVEWRFDNGKTAAIRVTANRIVAWPFAPDWGNGVIERLEWLTDVLTSETLAEQRRALRSIPRRFFEAPLYAEGRERQLLDLSLFGWGSRVWALPIWPDIQLLQFPVALGAVRINCQTEYLDFTAGGLAMLRGEDAFTFEVVEVDGVDEFGLDLKRGTQQAWPVRSRLYPARPAQLLEAPQMKRLHDRLQSTEARFLVLDACDWPAVMPATLYRGFPVLEQRPEESDDLTSSYARILSSLDNGAGLPLHSDLAQKTMPVQQWRWLEQGRAERAQLRSLLYALRGQQVPVWVPTHADDLRVIGVVSAQATVLEIEHIGYTRFAKGRVGRRDLRIELHNGTVFHRRVTGSTELSTTVERLIIDSALGVQVEPGAFARISWMALSRLSSDEVEIDHHTDSEGVAACSLTFRGVRDDEL